MSTRGCIAIADGDGWRGLYNHFDSYPTELGKKLWAWLRENGPDALPDLLERHPGGFSSFPEGCYCHDPDFATKDGSAAKDSPYYGVNAPDGTIDSQHANPLWIEWVYVVDPSSGTISVFASECDLVYGSKEVWPEAQREEDGWYNYGPCRFRHKLVAQFNLYDDPEPDWEALEATVRASQ